VGLPGRGSHEFRQYAESEILKQFFLVREQKSRVEFLPDDAAPRYLALPNSISGCTEKCAESRIPSRSPYLLSLQNSCIYVIVSEAGSDVFLTVLAGQHPAHPGMFCIMFIMLMQVFMWPFLESTYFSASPKADCIFVGSFEVFASAIVFLSYSFDCIMVSSHALPATDARPPRESAPSIPWLWPDTQQRGGWRRFHQGRIRGRLRALATYAMGKVSLMDYS